MADMTDIQKTYVELRKIADAYPCKFIREWNKGLDYTSPLVIRKMEEFNDTINAFGLSPIQIFRLDYDEFLDTDNYFLFDGYRLVSDDKVSNLIGRLEYWYDRLFYRWVYNYAFPEFSVTNDEKSFYNQYKAKGE
nr:MAG TPA: hypothetical protein [Caudoviricetes sp.]